MPTQPSKTLETFDNPRPDRDYIIEIRMPEFTCLCPKTGQPDFATLYLDYVPDKRCVELKSLKLYIWSFRNEGHFHEDVTNAILADLVKATAPRYMRLRAEFYVRGGIYTTVSVEHRKSGWVAPPPPPILPDDPDAAPPTTDAAHAPAGGRGAAAQRPPATPADRVAAAKPVAGAPAPNGRFRMLARERRPAPAPTAGGGDSPTPAPAAPPPDGLYLGIDIGTGGCRVMVIDEQERVVGEAAAPIPVPVRHDNQITQDSTLWWKAADAALRQVLQKVPAERIRAIAVDGTSGTLLLTDKKGAPVTPALMYNDSRAVVQADRLLPIAGRQSGAHGATSSLAKLLWLTEKQMTKKAAHALHQADWITGKLTGRWGVSDHNNSLKLGYDSQAQRWPDFLGTLGLDTALLPEVYIAGEPIGTISAEIAKTYGLSADTQVMAGTTDGVASFLAAGASRPGHGVTALGSTLVIKLLSNKPVFAPEHGVYSHRLGERWLVGGASNSGGATLLQYFKVEQMQEMTPLLDPESFTGLEYYPLPDVGERFPVNDPNMVAKLEPLPGNSVTFFQGMLEGIASIEALGYQLLHKLGAPAVTEVRTTGGGSRNPGWTRIRERTLGVSLKKPRSGMAAFGTALIAAGRVDLPS
ncbi:MAG TPA: preQ(1) synthase [Acidiferrobacterales bacterium]